MLTSVALGHEIDRAHYEAEEPKLRTRLLSAQAELLEKKPVGVCIVIGGIAGAGKGEVANLIAEWFDPRHVETHGYESETPEEACHPTLWRYWQRLPPRGKIGVFVGSWYTEPAANRARRANSKAAFERELDNITAFEEMLSHERVLVIKIWLHLSKSAQRKKLSALEADEGTRFRVTEDDWEEHDDYERHEKINDRMLERTSTGFAPWNVIEATNTRYRNLAVGETLLAHIKKRVENPVLNEKRHAPPTVVAIDRVNVLSQVDMTKTIADDVYDERIKLLQSRLNAALRKKSFRKRSAVVVFEGVDAAGKGGAIRRICAALDARQYKVVPIAAPSEEERAYPYLWRFFRRLPRRGRLTIFDRSYYGRVLVERVENFCDEDDWLRAYREITAFENALLDKGTHVIKFWLQIDQDEQLRRFEERQNTDFKRFKIGEEDYRNRAKWDAYQSAASEMIERTGTDHSPWVVIGANDKRHARLKVLETLARHLD